MLTVEFAQSLPPFDTNLALVLGEPQGCTRICAAKAVVSLLDPAAARPTDVEISTQTPTEHRVLLGMLSWTNLDE